MRNTPQAARPWVRQCVAFQGSVEAACSVRVSTVLAGHESPTVPVSRTWRSAGSMVMASYWRSRRCAPTTPRPICRHSRGVHDGQHQRSSMYQRLFGFAENGLSHVLLEQGQPLELKHRCGPLLYKSQESLRECRCKLNACKATSKAK